MMRSTQWGGSDRENQRMVYETIVTRHENTHDGIDWHVSIDVARVAGNGW